MEAKGNRSEEETMMEDDSDYLTDTNVAARELYPELEQAFDLQDQAQRMEFLSVAQHHGYPTPFIDFTDSPFVAAYFAVRDAKQGSPSRILSENIQVLSLFKSSNKALAYDFVRPLPKHNKRIVVQQGVFVLSMKSDLMRYLATLAGTLKLQVDVPPSSVLRKPLVGGFLLEVPDKNEILKDLDLMGINEYTLFGGLDGAFKYQKWKQLGPSPQP
jgi:hypothetical protein